MESLNLVDALSDIALECKEKKGSVLESGSEATTTGLVGVELKEVKALFPAHMIEACNTSFVQVNIE